MRDFERVLSRAAVSGRGDTVGDVPMYEFRCGSCDARFELLVDAGTKTAACPECGDAGAERLLSAPGAPLKLTKTGGDRRKQERGNEALRKRTKVDFKAKRKRAREARRAGGDG
jgi:putative FmdB family regulatory protein